MNDRDILVFIIAYIECRKEVVKYKGYDTSTTNVIMNELRIIQEKLRKIGIEIGLNDSPQ